MTFPTINKHMTTAVEELSNRAMTFGDQLTMIIPQEVCTVSFSSKSGAERVLALSAISPTLIYS